MAEHILYLKIEGKSQQVQAQASRVNKIRWLKGGVRKGTRDIKQSKAFCYPSKVRSMMSSGVNGGLLLSVKPQNISATFHLDSTGVGNPF